MLPIHLRQERPRSACQAVNDRQMRINSAMMSLIQTQQLQVEYIDNQRIVLL